jgi:nucleoside-diphosphate-sugar epimerase
MIGGGARIQEGSRVLVTGATGFTGSVLTRKLAGMNLDVRAIARQSSDTGHLSDLGVTWFRGDVFDPSVVREAAGDAEYIFHLATAYRQGGTSKDSFFNVHVASTRLLAETARSNPDFKRFVHISTVGVHGHIEGPPADENHPFAPGDEYQATKAEAEIWIRQFAEQSGLPVTVLRPTAIYGPGDRRLLKLFKMAAGRFFVLLGYGKCYYHLIHVEDLTEIMLLAAVHPAAPGQVFICGSEEATTLPEIGRIVAEELGHHLTVVRLPAFPFFAAAAVVEAVCRPLGLEPPIYRRRVAFFTKDRKFNTGKLKNVLGYEIVFSNRDGLVQTLRWYVEQGWLKRRKEK